MSKKSQFPPGLEHYYKEWHFSPAVESNGFVFVSGCTGERPDGTISDDPGDQSRQAFDTIGLILSSMGLSLADIVEMTTYHVGLHKQMELFLNIKDEYIGEPYPAWTAIGISELSSKEEMIEIRVTARRPSTTI